MNILVKTTVSQVLITSHSGFVIYRMKHIPITEQSDMDSLKQQGQGNMEHQLILAQIEAITDRVAFAKEQGTD